VLVAAAPACATKKFVRTEVGNVNSKVDTLSGTLEQTQERTRQNEARIGAVDQKAEAAGKAADSAGRAAESAGRAAADARKAADAAAAAGVASATAINSRVDGVEAAAKRLIYQVTLSEDQGNFKFGAADLPDAARMRLDEVVNQLKADPKTIFIEVEGHTDNVGPPELNQRLGLERAEAVKRYLYEQHQVPLHKINVISYGEDKPIAPNTSRQGRAQNRRVVVKILS
jgi:outer membrane protein OmpA-like peptidoglycan-associated protein